MFSYTPAWSDSAIRRFILRVGISDIPLLFDVRRADALSMDSKADFTLLNEFEERIKKELENQNVLTLKDLKINGNDVKALFKRLYLYGEKEIKKIVIKAAKNL